jgi:hypothetical protein
MNKHNYTDHSISKLHNQILKHFIKRPIFGSVFFSLLLFSFNSFALTKIAIVDTGFCPVTTKKNVIHEARDMTGKVVLTCGSYTPKELAESPRFHGQKVMEQFLAILLREQNVEVHPLIIFDDKGVQTKEAWLKAIDVIRNEKIEYVLAASSLPTDEILANELPGIWFVASGRAEHGLKKSTTLFPQSLAPKENLFLIGDYLEGKSSKDHLYDQNLLYADKIDYYFPSGNGIFTGTSRAVTAGLARALNLCGAAKQDAKSLRSCLKKKSVKYQDRILKKQFLSY